LFDQSIGENERIFLETWVAENPGSRQFVRLAWAYTQEDRWDDAIAILQRGLVINPGFIEARALLAGVLEKQGDADGAIEQLQLAARELQGHYPIFEELARLQDEAGRTSQARRAAAAAEALAWALEDDEPPAAEPVPPVPEARKMEPAARQKLVSRLDALQRAAKRRSQRLSS